VRLRVWTCPGMALWHSETRARELQPGLQRLQLPAPAFNGRCGIDGCKRTFRMSRDLSSHIRRALPTSRSRTTARSLPSTAPAPPALERREAAGPLRGSQRSRCSTCVSITQATLVRLRVWTCPGMALWHSETRARELQPGSQRLHAAPAFNGRCGIDGCKRTFDEPRHLIAHQEGPSHLAIPYYCPLTAEHCPRAPCPRAQGGSGGPFVGRNALHMHLRRVSRRPHRCGCGSGPVLGWPCGISRPERRSSHLRVCRQ